MNTAQNGNSDTSKSCCSHDLLCALEDLKVIATAIHQIVVTTKEGVVRSAATAERAALDKMKAKREARKERFRIAYSERNSGKTYKEVGIILGVTAGRAMDIFNQSRRMNDHGRLFQNNE